MTTKLPKVGGGYQRIDIDELLWVSEVVAISLESRQIVIKTKDKYGHEKFEIISESRFHEEYRPEQPTEEKAMMLDQNKLKSRQEQPTFADYQMNAFKEVLLKGFIQKHDKTKEELASDLVAIHNHLYSLCDYCESLEQRIKELERSK